MDGVLVVILRCTKQSITGWMYQRRGERLITSAEYICCEKGLTISKSNRSGGHMKPMQMGFPRVMV